MKRFASAACRPPANKHVAPTTARSKQQGITLFVVIVIVLMTMLLALWGSRSALFNQMVISNEADYQRAFEAAQALLQDAELDIRQVQSNGSKCVIDDTKPKKCRSGDSITKWVDEDKELTHRLMEIKTASSTTGCQHGLCIKRVLDQDFWTDSDLFEAMTEDNIGARYGEYTGALTGDHTNPLLALTGENEGGWYWIEILPYDSNAGNTQLFTEMSTAKTEKLPLHMTPNVVYRITALAFGRKPGSRVVLQSTLVRQKLKN